MEKWALRFIDRNINQMPVGSVAVSNTRTPYICGIQLLPCFYPTEAGMGVGTKDCLGVLIEVFLTSHYKALLTI